MSSSQAQPPPGVDPTKFARRAIGRSPEEHAALERVLAERRRRRGVPERGNRARSRSPVAGPSAERADLTWTQPLTWAQRRRAVKRREREYEQLLAAYEQQLQAQAHAQRVARDLPTFDAGQDFLALPVAQRRAAVLAPFGVTGERRQAKGKSKGAGWHERGYRDDGGYMWINVKSGEECTQGQDVNEGETLVGFMQQIQGFLEGSEYGCEARRGTLAWDLLFCKRSLRQLLTDLKEARLGDGDVLVRDLFDGGETVYYRLYDEDGTYVKHLY